MSSIGRLFWSLGLSVSCVSGVFAQSCPHGRPNYEQLANDLQHAAGAETVYRAVAVGGSQLAPVLSALSSKRGDSDQVGSAAQMSLAKLGDQNALQQLAAELNDNNRSVFAADKLFRVSNDQALGILLEYLQEHLHDDSLHHDFGDYDSDFRTYLIMGIARWFRVGPITKNGEPSLSYLDWVNWWNGAKNKPVIVPIAGKVEDPYVACLVRKIEWGFPDAILDLANTKDPDVIPILHKLRSIGPEGFTLNSIPGRAQFALAQLGDRQAFNAIVSELRSGRAVDQAIRALEMLGGKNSVEALVNAFDSPEFLSDFRTRLAPETISDYENRRDIAIASALHEMILNPPDPSWNPLEKKAKWKIWWARNKNTAQYATPPVKAYE